ncbi:hypothetical protein GCM10020256_58610 [Streptomyces thermocoprophilus]
MLDAYREDGVSSQKLGYLTPEEFGYVVAKRALVFGEDPSVWFTSAQAYAAYVRGVGAGAVGRAAAAVVGGGVGGASPVCAGSAAGVGAGGGCRSGGRVPVVEGVSYAFVPGGVSGGCG